MDPQVDALDRHRGLLLDVDRGERQHQASAQHRGGSPEALFTAADRSLLEAKRRGRNTVVGAGEAGR